MAYRVGGLESQEEFDKKLREMFPERSSYSVGNTEMHFNTRLVQLKNGAIRVVISNADNKDADSLYVDARPGPKTGKNQSAVILDYSEKGSKHKRAVTNEVYFNSENPIIARGDVKTRTAYEAFRDTAYGSFFVPGHRASGQQGKFNWLATQGDERQQLSGGWLNVSPLITSSALQSLARNVTVGFGKAIKNPGKLVDMVNSWINPRGTQPTKTFADFFQNMAGLIPSKEVDGKIRYRPVNESAPEENAAGEYMFYHLGKLSRGITASRGEREQLSESGMFTKDPKTGLLIPLAPKPITDMSAEGTRRLNIQIGEGVAPSALVSRNVLSAPGLPDSGARIVYGQSSAERAGEVGPFYETQVYQPQHPSTVSELERTSYEWGIFGKDKRRNWVKKSDMVGYALEPNQKVVLGLQTVIDKSGNKKVTPIRYKNTDRVTVINGLPTLNLPPAINDVTDQFAPVPGRIYSSEGEYDARELSNEEIQKIQANMGGGQVSANTIGDVSLSIPLAVANAFGEKQYGTKSSIEFEYGAIGEGKRDRTVHVGEQEVELQSITASVKNPLLNFLYGQLGTMPTTKIRQLVSEMYGKDSPLLPEIDKTIAYQNDLLNNTALTEAERSEQWRGVDIEKLAMIQAEKTGNKLFASSPLSFVDDLRKKVLQAQTVNPERLWNEYQMGIVKTPEYVDIKTINAAEIDFQRTRLQDAIKQQRKETPDLYTDEEWSGLSDLNSPHSLFKFEQIKGHEDLYKWSIKTFGLLGTQASALVTEHGYRSSPRLSLEQAIAISTQYPKEAGQIMADASKLESPGNKAWGNMVRYFNSLVSGKVDAEGKPLMYGKRHYTTLTDSQALEIGTKISSLEGNSPELVQGVVDEVIGRRSAPLLRMERSGAIFPAPKTIKGVSEMDVVDESAVINVDRFSRLYQPAFSDFLINKTESTPILKFEDTLISALTSTGGGILKGQESVPVIGTGGKGAASAGLHPNVVSVTDSRMRQYIRESLVTQGVIKEDPRDREELLEQRRILNQAYAATRKQGGLPAFYTKSPSYTKEDSINPVILKDSRMLRDEGLNVPPDTYIKNGRIVRGGTGLWGMVGGIGIQSEKLIGDFDVDPAVLTIAERWQKIKQGKKVKIAGTAMQGETFKGLLKQTDSEITQEISNVLKGLTGSNAITNLSAYEKEMQSILKTIATPITRQQFIDENKFSLVTQEAAGKTGQTAMNVKSEMGKSFNVRRRIDSVMEVNPDITEADQAHQYSALGLSYARHLEMPESIPLRRYEQMLQSFTPYYDSGKKGGGQPHWGFQYKIDETESYNRTPSLDINETEFDFEGLVNKDVSSGVLNPEGALMLFSRNSREYHAMLDEFNQNPENRDNEKNMGDAVQGIITRNRERQLKSKEGYDFNQTVAGQVLKATFIDKLKGTSGHQYRLPKGSEIGPRERAIGFMANEQITWDGKQTTVGEILEDESANVANSIFKAMKRKNGVLLPDELVGISLFSQNLREINKPPKEMLKHLAKQFDADTVRAATETQGVHNVRAFNLEAFKNYRPTPNELNKVLDESNPYRAEFFQNVYAKTQLDLHSLSDYIQEDKTFTDLGNKFEDEKGDSILSDQGYTSIYRPKATQQLGETGSIFNWTGGKYRIDVLGINPKTNRFFVGDYKWTASEASANDMLAMPEKSLPQLTAYADTLYRMAHPETYLKNWDEVKESLDGDPGETYFTKSIIESLKHDQKHKLTETDTETLRKVAPEWYHAIRESGVERITLAGTGGQKPDDPMRLIGAREWGAVNDESEAIQYNDAAVAIMQGQTEGNLTNYANQVSDKIKSAEQSGVDIQKLPQPARQQLDLATKARLTRGIPADIPSNRVIAGNTSSKKREYRGSKFSGNNGSNGPRGPYYPPSSGEGPWARETTVRELTDYMEERFGPVEDDTRPFSRKNYDRNLLKQRFLTGVEAAQSILDKKEAYQNYPKEIAEQTSQALLAVGAVPSITYDQTSGRFLSGGSVVAGDEANTLIAKDFARLEKENPVAYEQVARAHYKSAKETAKQIVELQKGDEARQKLGITANMPVQYEQGQQIIQAKEQTPNLALAAAITGNITGNPKNKPAGYVGSEESAQATISRYQTYKDDDALGKFGKKLSELDKVFDDIAKTGGDVSKSNKVRIEVDGKLIELSKKLNETQTSILEQAKEAVNGPTDRVTKGLGAIDSADETLRRYQAGEISAEEALPTIKKGLTAMGGVSSATKTLGKIEQEVGKTLEGDYPGAQASFGESFRHAFGGFGLFYLRTLFSYGFGSYQKGYEATIQQKTLANQLATARYGAASVEPYESEELQKQRNLLISGGSTWENLQGLGNAINKSSDVSGAVMSGLGISAAVHHLAKPITAVGIGIGKLFNSAAMAGLTDTAVAGAAPIAGLIAGTAMLGYSLYSNAIDYDNSIMRAAAGDDPYYKGQNLAAGFTLLGPKLTDLFSGNMVYDQEGKRITAATATKENYQREFMLADKGWATRQHYMLMPSDEQQQILNSLAMNGPAPLKGLTPEQSLSLLNRYTTGDINSLSATTDGDFLKKVGNIGRAEIAGRDVGLLSQQVAVATGMGYKEHGDLIDIADYYAKLSGAEFTKSTIGMDLMNRMPSISRNLNEYMDKATGLPKLGELQKKFDMLAEIGSGPLADAYMQRIEVAKNAAAVGRTIDVNPEDFALTFNPSAQSGQIFAQNALYSRQNQLSSILQQAGMNGRRANNFVDNFASAQELNFAERLMSFSPTAIGDLAQGLSQAGENQGAAYFDKFALTDYNLQGQQTGLGHWTTSLRGATSSAVQNANMIWGKGNWEGSKIAQAAVYGINRDTGEIYKSGDAIPEGANVVGGQRGIQWQQYYQGIEYQQKQFGIQQRQLALQEQYQPMFWAQEDKQREFSYRQQEWSFNQQEASMEMQSRHFQQNMAFQQKQAYMQRGWTAEDWGYQDLTRSMQWGWKQEDFAEQSRFMTGRDRKIAERGMERETTLFNLESGQIDKTRDRQKQMWALEDERFAIQKEQYAEQKKFQEDALAKQREFFEEQKQLTEESVTLNRQYQTEQIALQKESLAIQMEYAVTQNETNKLLMEMSDKEEDMQAAFALAKEKQLEFFNMAVEGFEFLGIEFKQMIQSIISGTPYEAGSFASGGDSGSGSGGGGGNVEMPMAKGGDMFPGMAYIVGEAGMERVRPNTLGSVVNQYDIAQTLRQTDRWTNRSVFYPSNQGSTSGSPQTINVYVGNDKLASFVLNTVKKDLEVF